MRFGGILPRPREKSVGPLHGIRIIEFAGLGPGPLACMLMADLGACVVRVERPEAAFPSGYADPVLRGRDAIRLDLKAPEGVAQALRLIGCADVLIEGFRPGVMEAIGLGPEICLERNPTLVYTRMTGWGQSGPMAQSAGHDINYIALTGALDRIGPADGPPVAPLNLLGDYGGGALYLAFGVVSALLHARASRVGQVIDVAMVDGIASLLAKQYGLLAAGQIHAGREQNLLDGGAPFYSVYACADGGYVAVGAIEAKFYQNLVLGLDLDPVQLPAQLDRSGWPKLRKVFAERFATRPRDAWAEHFATTDACVTPVLSMQEALHHPHLTARDTFLTLGGIPQPGPAPRFVATPAAHPSPAGCTTAEAIFLAWGAAPGSTTTTEIEA